MSGTYYEIVVIETLNFVMLVFKRKCNITTLYFKFVPTGNYS